MFPAGGGRATSPARWLKSRPEDCAITRLAEANQPLCSRRMKHVPGGVGGYPRGLVERARPRDSCESGTLPGKTLSGAAGFGEALRPGTNPLSGSGTAGWSVIRWLDGWSVIGTDAGWSVVGGAGAAGEGLLAPRVELYRGTSLAAVRSAGLLGVRGANGGGDNARWLELLPGLWVLALLLFRTG